MDAKVGRQSPTVSVILPYTDTKGPEAIELYKLYLGQKMPYSVTDNHQKNLILINNYAMMQALGIVR